MSFLSLFQSFILRALWREKIRSLVAALGIALGVAVMLAIRLANFSVTETFEAAVDSVSGNTSLRIRGTAGRFDERKLIELDWLSTYGQFSPVVEAYAMVDLPSQARRGDGAFPRGELLHVMGVDVLLDFPLREYQVLQFGSDDQDSHYSALQALHLLDDPRSVILTEKFLRRHRLRVGDTVPLTFGSTSQDFRIRGVLLNRGPARTLDGNFALMDIAAAQLATDRLGLIDYVDVMLRPQMSAETMLTQIQHQLPRGLTAELPDAASGRAETMVAAFQFNLSALSAVALIVGLFLIYNTVAISVAARRSEIGLLQTVGATRRTILCLFLAEALLLATVGVAVGIPAGRLLATSAVSATSQTVEIFYIANVAQSSAAALAVVAVGHADGDRHRGTLGSSRGAGACLGSRERPACGGRATAGWRIERPDDHAAVGGHCLCMLCGLAADKGTSVARKADLGLHGGDGFDGSRCLFHPRLAVAGWRSFAARGQPDPYRLAGI